MTTFFLAQVFGVYLVVVGILLLTRRTMLRSLVRDFFSNRALIFLGGAFTFLIGLMVVLSHNVWEASWVVLVTIVGWATLLKGLFYLFASPNTIECLSGMFNEKRCYVAGGIASLIMGGYLAVKGFGLM